MYGSFSSFCDVSKATNTVYGTLIIREKIQAFVELGIYRWK